MKLSGSGTLTVTVNYDERYGLYADSNYYDWKYDDVNDEELPANNSAPSVLAAPGYTVSRSAIGTNTWTYTVAPQP